jgi:Tol biopolymer transport system component
MSVQADGLGRPDTLYRGDRCPIPRSISPDGRRILLQTYSPERSWDLSVATVDTILGPITDYLAADWFEGVGRVSPDGRWVAYTSGERRVADENAGSRIYVTSFPQPGERFPVSVTDANYAAWAPDSRTIYYASGDTLIAARVQTSPRFAVTDRRILFTRSGLHMVDVHPDGRRFVMTRPASTAPATTVVPVSRLVMVVNWLEEFRRKAGASR